MIKAIFFDLYNTLAGFYPSRYDIQAQVLSQFDITVTPTGILRGYHLADSFMSEQNASVPIRKLDASQREKFFGEYERKVLEGAGIEVSIDKAKEIWKLVRKVDYEMTPFEDTIPALIRLQEKGFILGLITNIDQKGERLASDLGLSSYLDFTVTSQESGAEKPSPKIFERALEKAEVKASDSAHVGDQLRSDVAGAANVGIRPILIDRDCNHIHYVSHPRIESLKELDDVILNL